MTIAGIDHVQLAAPAGCEVEARAFFSGVLGLREIHKPEPLADRGGVWFACGEQELHVGIDSSFAPAHEAHPAFLVANLDEVAERLARAGVAIRRDEAVHGLRRHFYAEDPFGNRLEFVEEGR